MVHGIKAEPYDYPIEDLQQLRLLIIDVQRDFFAVNRYGASLGNDVSNIWPCIPYLKRLIDVFRNYHLQIIYTQGAQNLTMSNCPLTKRTRGTGPYRIGDPIQGGLAGKTVPYADAVGP